MIKLIIILVSFFVNLNIVNANIFIKDTIYSVSINNEIINIKEISYNGNMLFNIDINNYDINDALEEYVEENKDINKFSTIVYYGYLENPTIENYVITQLIVWNLIGNFDIEFINISSDMLNQYNVLLEKINNHYLKSNIFDKVYNDFIWTTSKFEYDEGAIILDNPKLDEIDIKTIGNKISLYPKKVGKYTLNFSKDYDNEIRTYKVGNNIYWQSLKGPEDINYSFNYHVFGGKLNIIENLIGVNGRTGDASLNSTYQIIYNKKELFTTNDLDNIYLVPEWTYKVKDISNAEGINNIEEFSVKISGNSLDVNVDKYVISKNISINVLDNYEYNIHLKSNNEIYEKVTIQTDVITLPYGTYYIENKDTDYYQEIIVKDSIDEEITVKSEIKEVVVPDDINKEEVMEELQETSKDEISNVLPEINDTIIDNIENPKTFDNIDIYVCEFIISLVLIKKLIRKLKKESY